MQLGLIAEGPFDQEVIRSVVKGSTGIDDAQVVLLRPELSADRTDRSSPHHTMKPDEYSNFALVQQECATRTKIRGFLGYVDEERRVIVHIDTDRAADYGVDKPAKAADRLADYVENVRRRVVATMIGWLEDEHVDEIVFAVAIEETEAWLLAHWDVTAEDTARYDDPKRRFHHVLNNDGGGLSAAERRQILRQGERERGAALSKPLRKKRTLDAAATRSRSLALFVAQLPAREDH